MENRSSLDSSHNQNKINDLDRFLDKTPEKQKNQNVMPGVTIKSLAHSLFDRAPSHFISTSTTEELAQIADQCFETCSELTASSSSVLVRTGQRNNNSYLIIALGDRPFIINTTVLTIRQCGSDVQTLLHPLISLESGKRLSLLYVTIDKLGDETLNLLQDRLERALSDLIFVTEDYSSVLSQVETTARILKERVPSHNSTEMERSEIGEFLRWLSDGGFVFLGLAEWQVDEAPINGGIPVRYLNQIPKNTYGLFRSNNHWGHELTEECRKDASLALEKEEVLYISKLLFTGIVHRADRVSHIVILNNSSDGSLSSMISIVGLFTSQTLAQEASTIPNIREKVKKLISLEQAIPNSYSYKNLIKIIDSMPKEFLLRSDVNVLNQHLKIITGIQRESKSTAVVHLDPSGKGANITVVMPRRRFSEQVKNQLQKHIEYTFGATPGSGDIHVALNVKPLVLIYYHVAIGNSEAFVGEIQKLESDLVELTKNWIDNLYDKLQEIPEFTSADSIWLKYRGSFSEEYQAGHSVEECIGDIKLIESLYQDVPLKVDISTNREFTGGLFRLSLYCLNKEVTVSHALPILENSGLHILHTQSYQINTPNSGPVFIHRYTALTKDLSSQNLATFKNNLCRGLEVVFNNQADSDVLNSLLISANLDIRAINLLRTYCAYLWQISTFVTKSTIRKTLAEIPSSAVLLWNIFEVKFNPELKLSIDKRTEKLEILKRNFLLSLRNVPDIAQDRVLRILANLLESTVRTNFYSSGDTIALKIDPAKTEIITSPRPYYEIYVRGFMVEGIHIRFGPVARGGIRWSDRNDDFRNEVLGLARTQKVKNVVIVPTGSKGGFILRNPSNNPEEVPQQVQECYREYIRSLLSITDNRIKGKTVHPDGMVIYDNEDPYLVVAADKGTATFSDIANKIAQEEFNFWLGDAFASGGTYGYDHKLYAITANGAWESVKRHFKDLAIDYINSPFTVIGIGDMSGDVFGNGLIYSDKIKLLAAFNHKHIFLDPDPDPAESFNERQRLFKLPRSQWTDYDRKLISKGGGIYGRFDKEIELSKEVRSALSISDSIPEIINGEQLIALILKAKSDLIWNGGIGTYFKASTETNAQVNDGTNDAVRIDANEIRARVVGEGGNLGFTQRARIEYELTGGRLNTDAIDNSGGVDLSDHEVNYKIFFTRLLEQNKIQLEERNKILKEVASYACTDVLSNNSSHALLLTQGSIRSVQRMDYFKSLIRELVREGYLDRVHDHLPDDDTLDRLAKSKLGLTRPELSRICAGVKMQLKDLMINSNIPDHPSLEPHLLNYFPPQMQERWKQEIKEHPLYREIITTRAINQLIDYMGATFVHRTTLQLNIDPLSVISCYLAVAEMINLPQIRKELTNLDTVEHSKLLIQNYLNLNMFMVGAISSIIQHSNGDLTISDVKKRYQEGLTALFQKLPSILDDSGYSSFSKSFADHQEIGLNQDTAFILSIMPFTNSIFQILWIASETGRPLDEIATYYNKTINDLGISDLLQQMEGITTTNHWDQELLADSRNKIRKGLCKLVMLLVKIDSQNLSEYFVTNKNLIRAREIVTDLNIYGPNIAGISYLAIAINSAIDEA